MGHHTAKDGYAQLVARLNQFPQGAPPTELLFKTLKVFITEEDAALLAKLPIRPFTVERAAKGWKLSMKETLYHLERLSAKCLLIDAQKESGTTYVLPPPMAGFFEFTLMRVREDVDQKLLSQMFYEYVTEEEDFMQHLVGMGGTPMGRTYVNEKALPENADAYILDYERASEIIKQAPHIAVGMCYCRHKKQHTGDSCDAPMDICMTFGNVADSLSRAGYARKIEATECLELLDLAQEHHLVQFGENIQKTPGYICNCCGCCCEALVAARRFGYQNPIATTNFIPLVSHECNGCGKCVRICPVEAMSLVSTNDPSHPTAMRAKVDEGLCLGCGVCVGVCSKKYILMNHREKRVITPVDTSHRVVMMAIERGQLQNLIFDHQVLASHRVMASILGALLKLPPAKQILASNQVKSKYLAALFEKNHDR
jgi:ferredoxin